MIPFRVLVRDCLSPSCLGSISLKDFICLVPDLPVLLREKVFGQNDINMKGEVVKLGNILKDFTKDERIRSVGPQSLFCLREFN